MWGMSQFPLTQPRRLVFPAKQQVEIQDFHPGAPGEKQVLIQIALSLMSTGTENIVFNQLIEKGTGWADWAKFPFYPGYSAVGTIEAVGPGVEKHKVGDRVAVRCGHQSYQVCAEWDCFPIPKELSFEQATWFALGKITFHGARAAEYKVGDSVLIIGAGPIGQLSTRWARACGAGRIIVIDSIAQRLELARLGGATATISKPAHEAKEDILAANHGQLPNIVIDSTGHPVVFASALGLARAFGKVVILGDTGTPSQQHLTSDVVNRGIHIVGAHDGHNTEEWPQWKIIELFLDMVAGGRISLDKMNTHYFKPNECKDAYGVVNKDRASTMGVIFKWS